MKSVFTKGGLYLWVMRFDAIGEIFIGLKEIVWVVDNWQISKPQQE